MQVSYEGEDHERRTNTLVQGLCVFLKVIIRVLANCGLDQLFLVFFIDVLVVHLQSFLHFLAICPHFQQTSLGDCHLTCIRSQRRCNDLEP